MCEPRGWLGTLAPLSTGLSAQSMVHPKAQEKHGKKLSRSALLATDLPEVRPGWVKGCPGRPLPSTINPNGHEKQEVPSACLSPHRPVMVSSHSLSKMTQPYQQDDVQGSPEQSPPGRHRKLRGTSTGWGDLTGQQPVQEGPGHDEGHEPAASKANARLGCPKEAWSGGSSQKPPFHLTLLHQPEDDIGHTAPSM